MTFVNYNIKDNAIGQLQSSVSAGAGSITLKAGEGANFPSLGAGEKFLGLLVQFDGNGFEFSNIVQSERVIATERSSDTVTITRGDEGDTPLAFDPDDYFIATWRAKDAQDMKDEIARLETDKLDIADYQAGNKVYAATSTGTDSYAITLSPAITSYTNGAPIQFQADVTNTGAATLDINGLGAKTIKKRHDLDLEDGDIEAGQIVTVVYDGTNFQMASQSAIIPTADIDGQTEDTTGDMDSDYIIKDDGGGNKKILVSKYRASDGEALALTVENKFVNPKQLGDLLEIYGVEMIAGTTYTAAQANTQRNTNSTTYVLIKQFTVDYGGTYTISFDMNRNNAAAAAYGRIYKNGSPFGTERVKSSTGFETYSENLAFADGDTCELRIKVSSAAYQTLVENFNAKYNFQPKFFGNLSVTVDTD